MDSDTVLGYSIFRLETRRLELAGIGIDLAVFFMWVLISGRILLQSSLPFWQIDDAWVTVAFYRLFAPPIVYMALGFFIYWQVFYGYLGLILIYVIGGIILLLSTAVAWVWLIADRANCSKTLWCANIRNFIVDDITRQKLFSPAVNSNPRPELIALIVVDIAIIVWGILLIGLSIWIYSIYNEMLRAYDLANKQRLAVVTPGALVRDSMQEEKRKQRKPLVDNPKNV